MKTLKEIAVVMAAAVALAGILALVIPVKARAEATAAPTKVFTGKSAPTGQPFELRISMSGKCEHPAVVAHLQQQGAGAILGQFKPARLTWEGVDFEGCWYLDEDDDVVAVYEDGSNLGYIPFTRFRDSGI